MVLQSTRWLALSYFTYFFSYGIFLPFWGVWLKGEGIPPETIGILLGAGLVARFLGSLLIAPRVKDPSHLVTALRLLALLTLAFAIGFCFGNGWGWLMLVIAGFNLFFSPLVPLTDALAGTWQKQITLDYGRVRLWGSLAFVIGSALTGQMISVWGHNAILYSLIISILAMLLGMMLKPSVMPQGEARTHSEADRSLWEMLKEGPVWRFLLCVTLLQGAHAGYYSFGSIYWQEAGYSASTIGYLWSLGVVAEVIIFASSNFLFRRWNARNLLLLSACCGILRWGLMASSTELGWLLVIQILHCGTFTVCHLAAMRFIAARKGPEVIRLQAVYSALAMGGGIAIMTVIAGFLFEHLQGGVFWVMAAVVVPALFIRPPAVTVSGSR
ncbi:3-phenylpropionate MFS transporter [Serratia proteamaculans]|jgi:PPP family 3-phenylpropionic acid transporter|uniref:3-phenylpropionate MFS transporter n=1 Tax=Serratia proteamaculans TaxID=28151 RepID=UPI0021779F2F|nr:3-phenylpropionate MFS transporter [Serratia proteamaculans]CAI1215155.1 Probable 3-phenylpropionic acid transporter [Serratia proteamaculans]CAI1811679.1 Probable 3-phenylpropionic acid transporter [Serratia proteamaculans]CAI1935919.1 Probable 3-phenylpropionic acid transporter [Serratia proteamaculans]CAI1940436.1 Probable 3-phenylpropionic acid transporter [Serratia proteamaculans]CAI1951306.1 Probable 3-phenylpropionic acid transporter [Serratia proteamaculans]